MATLGIFTVKKFRFHDGNYYTYGGFGEYLAGIRKYFGKVVLFARVRAAPPPEGWYLVPEDKLVIVHLPTPVNEAHNLLLLPIVFARSWKGFKGLDIIHARMPDYTGIVGAVIARFKGVPVFCQIIADWRLQAKNTPVMKRFGLGFFLKLDLYLYDFVERLVCRGQLVFAQGQGCHTKHAKHSSSNLVHSTAHHASEIRPPSEKFTEIPYRILVVARLVAVKNIDLLIHALAQLNDNSPAWTLDVVGAGPKRESLERLAAKLGLGEVVTLHGQIPRGDALWERFDNADVFVLPSRSEGSPKVILEAMARGLPVVASNVSGIPATLDHGNRGLVFEDNNLASLVSVLRRIEQEPALRRRLTANGHIFSREHCIESEIPRMMARVGSRWPAVQLLAPDEFRLAV